VRWYRSRCRSDLRVVVEERAKNKEERIKIKVMKHNFKNLNIWKMSIELADKIYDASDLFPKNEDFGLKSQIRRCAVSVPSNIAEGSSRTSDKDFNRFLEISLGSLFELQTQLIIAKNRNFINEETFKIIEERIIELQKMISGFQNNLIPR
jgi:four helix bundle protein